MTGVTNGTALDPLMNHLINHLWQSTVFALAVALLTLVFRKNRAQVRYWLWLSASLKFLVPFALLIALGGNLWALLAVRKVAAEIAAPVVAVAMNQIAQPFEAETSFASTAARHTANSLPIALIALWACGFAAIALMRLRGWMRIRQAVRASKPIDIAASVEVRSSPGLLEPGVVGFLRPTLLLPEGILQSLTPSQLEAVLAHELSHVRRRDNLTAAIHMLVEAAFWFYPVIWWIGARLVEERERACDEAVLALGNRPRDYAEAILNVCKLYVESPLVCVAGVTGADLKKRIQAILSDTIGIELTRGKRIALSIAAIVALALPVAIGVLVAPQLHAQSATGPLPSFEVASIKPDPDPSHRSGHSIHIHENNGYYTAAGLTAKYLIKYAYNLSSDDQLSGGPSWISSDPYAIDAKLDPALASKWTYREKQVQMRLVMQSLLADRFQLKVSHQTKELPVFNLVVAKGGPKIGPPTGDGDHQSNDGHNEGDVEIWQMKNEPIEVLVGDLNGQPEVGGHLVIDKTGLAGFYTFNWKWTRQRDSTDPSADADTAATTDAPSIWTALQQQLGLKLESAKGPVDTIVIEHIEQPSEN